MAVLGVAVVAIALAILPAAAQQAAGPVTNLPIPRYVSLKTNEANVRRGPGSNHRIDWVFVQRGTPLLVTAEFENWRRIQDQEGAGGWVHFTLLTGVRTVVVVNARITLHAEPAADARVVAYAERGVIGWIDACRLDWCEIDARDEDGRYSGWVRKSDVWGVGPSEILE